MGLFFCFGQRTRRRLLDFEYGPNVAPLENLEAVALPLHPKHLRVQVQVELDCIGAHSFLVVLHITHTCGLVVLAVMRVMVVDQRLEVADFDLVLTDATRYHRVQLDLVVGV